MENTKYNCICSSYFVYKKIYIYRDFFNPGVEPIISSDVFGTHYFPFMKERPKSTFKPAGGFKHPNHTEGGRKPIGTTSICVLPSVFSLLELKDMDDSDL